MPISAYFDGKGKEVLRKMKEKYGPEKGERVFYATAKKQGMEPKTEWVETSGGLMERGTGMGRGKINAPTFAYRAVYGSNPPQHLRGRTDAPKKTWKGMQVDKGLKNKWLEELDKLPVEIRSTEEGKSPDRPAFVIFRMPEGEDHLHKHLASALRRNSGIYCLSEIGQGGRPRICVAGKIWNTMPGWERWWDSLPGKIGKAYKEVIRLKAKQEDVNQHNGIIHKGIPNHIPGQMVEFSQLTETKKKSKMRKLKDNRTSLTPEERAEVMKRGAVWHHGPNGEKTPAVWKSKDPKTGKVTYVTNTHRAYQAKPTLKGAINAFKFIKTTA